MIEKQHELELRVAELEAAQEELQRTRQMLAARTAVAWMGMVGSIWRHSTVQQASAILNLVALLRHELKAETPAAMTEQFLDRIEYSARRIMEIPVAPPLASEESAHDISVNEVLRRCASRCQTQEGWQDVRIVYELDTDDHVVVRANAQWLRFAVDSLIDNAFKAMTRSPRKTLTLRSESAPLSVHVHIIDTGHGISEEIRSLLFREPVGQAEGDGLGMGLLLASMIIQAYGGDVTLSSTGPQGTTFEISLPRVRDLKG